MTSAALTEKNVKSVLSKAGLWRIGRQLFFLIITKSCKNQQDKTIRYYFNYSATPQKVQYSHQSGNELLTSQPISQNSTLELKA